MVVYIFTHAPAADLAWTCHSPFLFLASRARAACLRDAWDVPIFLLVLVHVTELMCPYAVAGQTFTVQWTLDIPYCNMTFARSFGPTCRFLQQLIPYFATRRNAPPGTPTQHAHHCRIPLPVAPAFPAAAAPLLPLLPLTPLYLQHATARCAAVPFCGNRCCVHNTFSAPAGTAAPFLRHAILPRNAQRQLLPRTLLPHTPHCYLTFSAAAACLPPLPHTTYHVRTAPLPTPPRCSRRRGMVELYSGLWTGLG